METGILTFSAAASTPSRPASAAAFRRHIGPFWNQSHNGFRQCLPISTTSTSSSSSNTRSNCGLSVKALNHNLTSNWDVENYAAPSRLPRFEELDTTNMLLRQRIVFLGNQVEDTTADFIISQLLLLDSEDSEKDIKLFINSPGGSITAGMGIYDAMKMCKADISTTCFGLAASMGAFLLAAGTKGKRYCMPNARVMIHGPSGGAGGAFSEFMIRTREMAYHGIKLNKILSKLTGQTVQQLEKDTERDNFMDAWQAKAYGLVDEVIDDGKPGLVAPTAEAIAPPEARIYVLYDIDGKRSAKRRENLPSEEKLVPTEHAIGEGKDEDKDAEQKKEVSTPV